MVFLVKPVPLLSELYSSLHEIYFVSEPASYMMSNDWKTSRKDVYRYGKSRRTRLTVSVSIYFHILNKSMFLQLLNSTFVAVEAWANRRTSFGRFGKANIHGFCRHRRFLLGQRARTT